MLNMIANTLVDQVQGTKKQLLNTLVTNKEINSILTNFVDSQTEYTKKAIDTGYNTVVELNNILFSHVTNFTKTKGK